MLVFVVAPVSTQAGSEWRGVWLTDCGAGNRISCAYGRRSACWHTPVGDGTAAPEPRLRPRCYVDISPAVILIAKPRMATLKAKEMISCTMTTRRMEVWVVDTSAVWQAAAMVKEK
jgi:hypothetical protein